MSLDGEVEGAAIGDGRSRAGPGDGDRAACVLGGCLPPVRLGDAAARRSAAIPKTLMLTYTPPGLRILTSVPDPLGEPVDRGFVDPGALVAAERVLRIEQLDRGQPVDLGQAQEHGQAGRPHIGLQLVRE